MELLISLRIVNMYITVVIMMLSIYGRYALQYKSIEFQYNNNKRCCGNAWNLPMAVRKPSDFASNNTDNTFGYKSSPLSHTGGVSYSCIFPLPPLIVSSHLLHACLHVLSNKHFFFYLQPPVSPFSLVFIPSIFRIISLLFLL